MSNPVDLNIPLSTSAIFSPGEATDRKSKIHTAAQQFEALMVSEMLKAARETGSEGWLGSGDSSTEDTAMSMAESQLSNALAKNGGLGLAKTIESALTSRSGQQ
jgi:flagellar protein FlgJ